METDKEVVREASKKYWESRRKKMVQGMEKDADQEILP